VGSLVALLAVAAVVVLGWGAADAPTSPANDLDARTLQVERQLLCPQCTNKRLDVCEEAICQDMRREIRLRLERGETEPQIVAFFAGRFGDRVLASVPKSGFNLWLWGWVFASLALAGLAAWSWLSRSGASSARGPAVPTGFDEADDGWLDAQLREAGRDLEAGAR
jgi:cytochrome c-type biogenesis protein CcmH/NrfF